MKKKFLLAALVVAIMPLSSCGDDDEMDSSQNGNGGEKNEASDKENDKTLYSGVMTVTYNGEEVKTEDVQSSCAVVDGEKLTIGLNNVKFVPNMPVSITLELNDITYVKANGKIVFNADTIVPTMAGMPFDRYTATNLKGEVSDGVLTYSLSFGSYPTSYTGKKN